MLMKRPLNRVWAVAGMAWVLSGLGSPMAWAVPLTDFTIFAVGNVKIGDGSHITGLVGSNTNVQLGGGSGVTGDTRSGDSVVLNNGAFVTGTITNPGTFTHAVSSTFGAHAMAMPDLPSLPPATVFSSGGTSFSLGNGANLTLTPGSYGSISLGGASKLNLQSGNYFFDSLSSGNGLDLKFNLSGGAIKLFVTGKANFGSVDVLLTNGGSASDIFLEAHGSGTNVFKAGGGSDWLGTVFAPNGEIHFGGGGCCSSFHGDFWSGLDVNIEHAVTGTPVPTPEPATLFLLGSGLLGLTAWKRMRMRRLTG
jgi:hypothetical protein